MKVTVKPCKDCGTDVKVRESGSGGDFPVVILCTGCLAIRVAIVKAERENPDGRYEKRGRWKKISHEKTRTHA